MKERLIQLLDLEQLSPSKFADIIGVQRSSISHVISGRNKPSFDFLQKTLKAFPGLNASWLMLGEGSMYEHMGRNVSGNLFDASEPSEEPSEGDISTITEDTAEIITPGSSTRAEAKTAEVPDNPVPGDAGEAHMPDEVIRELAGGAKKRIVQVMVIYEDDTFRAYRPAQ